MVSTTICENLHIHGLTGGQLIYLCLTHLSQVWPIMAGLLCVSMGRLSVLLWSGLGRQLSWGSSASFVFHPPPGASWPAQACLSHDVVSRTMQDLLRPSLGPETLSPLPHFIATATQKPSPELRSKENLFCLFLGKIVKCVDTGTCEELEVLMQFIIGRREMLIKNRRK